MGLSFVLYVHPPPHKGKGWDEGHGVRGRIVFERGEGSIVRHRVGIYYNVAVGFCRDLCYGVCHAKCYILYVLCYVGVVN